MPSLQVIGNSAFRDTAGQTVLDAVVPALFAFAVDFSTDGRGVELDEQAFGDFLSTA